MEKCDCCGLWEWSNQVIQRRNGKTGCPGQRSRAMGHSIRCGLRQWNGQFAVNCINKSNNSLMRKKINPCWNTQVLYYIVVSLHTFQLLQFHWFETKCVDCVWPKKVCVSFDLSSIASSDQGTQSHIWHQSYFSTMYSFCNTSEIEIKIYFIFS